LADPGIIGLGGQPLDTITKIIL